MRTQMIVSWHDNTLASATLQDFGVVDAGSVSATPLTYYLFNNKNGTTDVSKMENCRITTKDTTGGMSSSPVCYEKWMESKNVSTGDGAFHPVGSDWDSSISDYVEVSLPIGANDPAGVLLANEISGVANDGTLANSKANFVQIENQINIPSTAK